MKILVTGADGFIGSHMTEMLVILGYDVRALCLYNSFGSLGWLSESPFRHEIDVTLGDVRDPKICMQITSGMDIVINLAALIGIPYSYVAPYSYAETNITGVLNVAEACLANGVSRLVQISTSEVYGTATYVPIDERHPLQPQSPYSASKISGDALALSYYHTYELPVSIARPFNTFGPRQSNRAVIPTIISQILRGNCTLDLGDTTPKRDFNYVTDTCRGIIQTATSQRTIGTATNIGSGVAYSIQDTVEKIAELMGAKVDIKENTERVRPERSEVQTLLADTQKMFKLTGHRHEVSFSDGLIETINWFKANKSHPLLNQRGYAI